MSTGPTDFAEVFARLAAAQQREETASLGGVDVRMVRVAGAGEGRWDSHPRTAETVVAGAATSPSSSAATR